MRASYRNAVNWLALNDDNTDINTELYWPTVAAALVRDVFDVDEEKLRRDILREIKRCERAELIRSNP